MSDDRGAAALAERLHAIKGGGPRIDCECDGDAAAILGPHGRFLPDGTPGLMDRIIDNAEMYAENQRLREALGEGEDGWFTYHACDGQPRELRLSGNTALCPACGEWCVATPFSPEAET